MKRILLFSLVLAATVVSTAYLAKSNLTARHAQLTAAREALWEQEKAQLEAALRKSHGSVRPATVITLEAETPANTPALRTPLDVLNHLITIDPAKTGQTRTARAVIHDLEELIAAGPLAIPAIREFLSRNEDIDYLLKESRSFRDGVPDDFLLPPSLRFGLFDALKQIGGTEAEKLLVEILGTTGRGVELAWLARALQEIAPHKYREQALASAHELLARPQLTNAVSPLDRADRDNLLAVLTMFGDTTFVITAQNQLIQPDGSLDRAALRYLQNALGQQAIAIAATAWNDPRLSDPTKKEPLARLALNYAGADAQANEFYLRAINDLNLTKDQRRNLIEDLNQDGFSRNGKIGPGDLTLIENRIALIEQSAPNATDPVNLAAFKEAYKDLVKMREKLVTPPKPAP